MPTGLSSTSAPPRSSRGPPREITSSSVGDSPLRCPGKGCSVAVVLLSRHRSPRLGTAILTPPPRPARPSSAVPAAPARPLAPPTRLRVRSERSARFGRFRADSGAAHSGVSVRAGERSSGAIGEDSAHIGAPRYRLRLRSDTARARSGLFASPGRTTRGLGRVRAGSGLTRSVRYRFGPRRADSAAPHWPASRERARRPPSHGARAARAASGLIGTRSKGPEHARQRSGRLGCARLAGPPCPQDPPQARLGGEAERARPPPAPRMEQRDGNSAAGQLDLPAGPGQQREPPQAAEGEAEQEEAVTVMAADAEHIQMGAPPMPSADEAAAAAAFAGQGGQRSLSPPGAPATRAPAPTQPPGLGLGQRAPSGSAPTPSPNPTLRPFTHSKEREAPGAPEPRPRVPAAKRPQSHSSVVQPSCGATEARALRPPQRLSFFHPHPRGNPEI